MIVSCKILQRHKVSFDSEKWHHIQDPTRDPEFGQLSYQDLRQGWIYSPLDQALKNLA